MSEADSAALSSCWSVLCDVDVAPLVAWLAEGDRGWPPVKGGQPNRLHIPEAARPVIARVLACFDVPVTFSDYYACLSRVIAGRGFGYHSDPQAPEWITRVHVPVITNERAWVAFEEEGGCKVHFEVGKAYSFNALKRHAFSNDGQTDRIHLLFDVLRG